MNVIILRRVFLAMCFIAILFLGYWGGLTFYQQSEVDIGFLGQITEQEKATTTEIAITTTNAVKLTNMTNIAKQVKPPTTESSNNTAKYTTLANNKNITLYITEVPYSIARLGNQMFQYASLLGIARTQGRKLIVSADNQLLKIYRLHHVITNETITEYQEIEENKPVAFDAQLMNLPPKNCRIRGYLQSFKYFVSIEAELRHEFTFHNPIKEAAAKILAKFNWSMIVGVHVRRGDFLRDDMQRMGYLTPEKSYYIKAFIHFNSIFPNSNLTFLIVSDDIPWCKANLVGTNVITAPPSPADVHMAVLANCDHVIISSGTYGWWSAWLSGGHVVYFTGYLSRNTTLGNVFSSEDYYPNHWIGISN